jgi:hypothetical protein
MYAEITEKAFKALVKSDTLPTHIKPYNHAIKYHYKSHGVALLKIEQPTNPAQHFIQDINS